MKHHTDSGAFYKPDYYVVTGEPGAGKTTLLRELESRGYSSVDEVARDIIREQVLTNGRALPWKEVWVTVIHIRLFARQT